MKLHLSIVFAAVLLLTSAATAQRSSLSVGDRAPDLHVAEWINSDPVEIQSEQVTIVFFFQTGSGAARRALASLAEIYEHHRDEGLMIIGISTDEESEVRAFISRQRDQITFPIAVDQRSRTHRAWVRAAGLDSNVALFLIDRQRRVQFISQMPTETFAEVFVQVAAGRYDARLYKEAEPVINAARNARQMRNWRMAFRHLDELIELDKRVFAPFALTKFEIKLVDMNDSERAYTYAEQLLSMYADDPDLLLDLARKIAVDPAIDDEKRDLEFAMRAVQSAKRSAANPQHPRVLATEALVHFHKGNVDQAVAAQRRAWMIAAPHLKPQYERTMRSYERARQRN